MWFAFVLGVTGTAFAHPRLDDARARFDRADLRGALTALGRAEQASDLTRADVITLLEMRALVRFTLGDTGAMEEDLLRLASIDPDHRFGDDIPPDLSEAF